MKNIQIIFFMFLFLFPLAVAIEIEMKTDFNQGETLIAKISGNFYEPISKEDIIFNRDHVRTSIIPFVAKIDNDFYIYAQLLDKSPNNYSIIIENARFIQGNKIIEEEISKNFSINQGFADFSVNPGFIIADEDFFIEILNLKDTQISVGLTTSSEISVNQGLFGSLVDSQNENIVFLSSGETKKINFNINDLQEFGTIRLSTENTTYEIPLNILSKEKDKNEKAKSFKFEPSEIIVSISTDSESVKIIYLRNIGNETIENIFLSVSNSLKSYVNLSIDYIDRLEANSSEKIEIYFNSYDEEEILEGQIIALSEDKFASSYVYLDFVKDFIPLDENKSGVSSSSSKTCSELNGDVCTSTQECDGDTEFASDSVCCIGKCVEIKESSIGVVIGWSIITLIVLLLIWFYLRKYKKVEGVSDLMKFLKKK